ncbi:hypothetical protein FRC19_005185, partial [Serendipita sp. 401]
MQDPNNFTNGALFGGTLGHTHIHFASHDGAEILNREIYDKLAKFTSITCLEIWVQEDTVPFLSLPHRQLSQLIVSPPPGSPNFSNCEWIQGAVDRFPNLCSLHLVKPHDVILDTLCQAPSFSHLTELCIDFGESEVRKPTCDAFTLILKSTGHWLQTLSLTVGCFFRASGQLVPIELSELKELSVVVEKDEFTGNPFPFKLVTPKLETLIVCHFGGTDSLYDLDLAMVTKLVDYGTFPRFQSYISLTKLKVLHIPQAHIDRVKENLDSLPNHCPELATIVCESAQELPDEIWNRNGGKSITICSILESPIAWNVLDEKPWT